MFSVTKSVTIFCDRTFSSRVALVHDVADLSRLRVPVTHRGLDVDLSHHNHRQLQGLRRLHEFRPKHVACGVQNEVIR